MAYIHGTANGHKDLMNILRQFAVAQGWTEERYITDPDGEDELILSTNGISGNEFYTAAFRTVTNVSAGRYNIRIATAPAYNPNAWDQQPKMSPIKCIYCHEFTMEYWIMVNDRRIMMTYIVAGIQEYMYIGKLINYTSLGHYPRALMVAGTGNDAGLLWSTQGDTRSGFQQVRGDHSSVLLPNGAWAQLNLTWPTNITASDRTSYGTAYPGGDKWMLQMMGAHSTYLLLGEYEGCHWLAGEQVILGQIIDNPVTGNQHVVVQDVYRNGQMNYLAMELA